MSDRRLNVRAKRKTRWWCLVGGVPLGSMLVAIGFTARAQQFPPSALSLGMATRPEYVDPATLLFVFPQRAGISDSQIFALGLGMSEALGVIGQTRGHGFFLLSQPTSDNSSLFQAGWGGSLGGLRAGVAGRAARAVDERGDLFIYDDPFIPNDGRLFFDGAERTLWQGSAGLGFSTDHVDVDLDMDVHQVDAQLTFLELEFGSPSADTALVVLESTNDPSFGGTARFLGRFGGGVEAVAVGGWSRFEDNYDGLEYASSGLEDFVLDQEQESWFAGLSVSLPAGRIDRLTFAGHWQHAELGLSNRTARYQRSTTTEVGTISFALEQQLWRELHGRAGVALAYRQSETRDSRLHGSPQHLESYASNADFIDDFSWGVSYRWRNFDLQAAVRETLPLSTLFFAIDVCVRP